MPVSLGQGAGRERESPVDLPQSGAGSESGLSSPTRRNYLIAQGIHVPPACSLYLSGSGFQLAFPDRWDHPRDNMPRKFE